MFNRLFIYNNFLKFLFAFLVLCFACSHNKAQDSLNHYLNNSMFASFKQDCDKAVYWMDKARYLAEFKLDNNSKKYIMFLKVSIPVYLDCEIYDLAEQLSLEFIKKVSPNDPSYKVGLKLIAALYLELGKVEKAEKILVQALKATNSQIDTTSVDYIMHVKELGEIYLAKGDLAEAEMLFLRALKLTNLAGEQFPRDKLPVIFYNLGSVYSDLGQFDKSEAYIKKSKELTDPNTDSENYTTLLNVLGLLKMRKNEPEIAREYYKEALTINEKTYGRKSLAYARGLNNLASSEHELQNFLRAEELFLQSNQIVKEKLGTDHQEYAISINNLAGIYVDLRKIDNAISLYKESLAITEKLYGINHYSYGTTALNLASLCWEENNFPVAHHYFQKAIQNLLYQIKNIYPIMSEAEKLQFLNNRVRYFLQDFYSFTNDAIEEIPELGDEALNLLLATKTLALDMSINVRKKIIHSKQLDLLRLYEEWLRTRQQVYRIWMQEESVDSKNNFTLFDLEQKADSLEKVLNREIGVEINSFEETINWEHIQSQLKLDEVAIIFLNYKDQSNEKLLEDKYIAIVVDKSMDYPKWIELCNKNQIIPYYEHIKEKKGTYVDDTDIAEDLFQLIFGPLSFYLQNKKIIHYSSSGVLNKIAFSQLVDQYGMRLHDSYRLHQYGTIKGFVKQKTKKISFQNSIVLFGGVNFDSFQKNSFDNKFNNHDNSKKLGKYSWSYLPETEKEVKQIARFFDSLRWDQQLFKGVHATEENLKKYSNKSPSILHIATHGFFFPITYEDIQHESVDLNILKIISKIKNPMMRSGLILTGANLTWRGEKKSEKAEDGILTAYEIAHLDLHQTKLVVLSTCVSGLGQVEYTEGVMGMQRAFKQAGVEQLITSLWEIPDKESSLFMEIFYQYLSENRSVYEAFRKTQLDMSREYDPYYWAGFVLIE